MCFIWFKFSWTYVKIINLKLIPVVFFHERMKFKYLRSGVGCQCGNSLKYPSQNSSACCVSCSGDSNELCGGNVGNFSVYSLSKILKVCFLYKYFNLLNKKYKGSNTTPSTMMHDTTQYCNSN